MNCAAMAANACRLLRRAAEGWKALRGEGAADFPQACSDESLALFLLAPGLLGMAEEIGQAHAGGAALGLLWMDLQTESKNWDFPGELDAFMRWSMYCAAPEGGLPLRERAEKWELSLAAPQGERRAGASRSI